MFEQFALPDLARVSRRTALSVLAFGAVGLAACLFFNASLVGAGLCLGLGLGLLNFRLIQRSVLKVSERGEGANHRRPLAGNTVIRLGFLTAIALGLLFLSFDLGVGVVVGLAGFQFFLLLNVSMSMLKMGQAVAGGGDDSNGVMP